jgi:peptide/nickel transport system substrate-binding protein
MKKNLKRSLVFSLVFVMIFTLAACSKEGNGGSSDPAAATPPSADTGSPGDIQKGGILNVSWGETTEPFGLPWLLLSGSGHAGAPVGECLIMQTSDNRIDPWLAESYEVDLEAGQIRFKLREDVKFHDGSQFNADAVGWEIQQYIDHNVLSPAMSGYEILGEYEVAITFETYSGAVISMLASHAHAFVSKENYEKVGEEKAMQIMCGTGPFKVESFVPGGEVVLVKNDDYWRKDLGEPYLDGMTFQNLTDQMSQTLAVQTEGSAGIDFLCSSSQEQVATLRDTADVDIITNPNGAITLFPSSIDPNSPFAKLEVRQALAYAINRDPLLEARGFGMLQPAYQFIPDIYQGHLPESDELPHFDPEKAKELLAEAGYPDGFKTKLIGEYGLVDQDFVVALASQLADVGIECELEFPTQAASNEYRMAGGYDGLFIGRLTTFTTIYLSFMLMGMDPTSDQFYPSTWRPTTQEAQDLFLKVRLDAGADASLPAAYQKLMLENVVNVPIYYTAEYYVLKSNVHGGGLGEWAGGVDWLPGQIWKEQ